jgi:hypothetical protein
MVDTYLGVTIHHATPVKGLLPTHPLDIHHPWVTIPIGSNAQAEWDNWDRSWKEWVESC